MSRSPFDWGVRVSTRAMEAATPASQRPATRRRWRRRCGRRRCCRGRARRGRATEGAGPRRWAQRLLDEVLEIAHGSSRRVDGQGAQAALQVSLDGVDRHPQPVGDVRRRHVVVVAQGEAVALPPREAAQGLDDLRGALGAQRGAPRPTARRLIGGGRWRTRRPPPVVVPREVDDDRAQVGRRPGRVADPALVRLSRMKASCTRSSAASCRRRRTGRGAAAMAPRRRRARASLSLEVVRDLLARRRDPYRQPVHHFDRRAMNEFG